MMARWIKVIVIILGAVFFSLIAIGNIIGTQADIPFAIHVIHMNSTLTNPLTLWQAAQNVRELRIAYYAIIIWELLTASVLWVGAWVLYRHVSDQYFNQAKKIALLGLFMGLILYMLGFLLVGDKWFAMWHSLAWSGGYRSGVFLIFIFLVLIFIAWRDEV